MSENPKIVSVGSPMEIVNGSHEFIIQGYSLAKDMGIGNHLASDSFTVGGYQWAVHFYPDGKFHSEKCSSTHASLFIALVSEGSDVRALFELIMVDQSGRERHRVNGHFDRIRQSRHFPFTLKQCGSMWGYRRYFRRAWLEKSDFLKNDCLKIKCTVGVVVSTAHRPRLHSGNILQSEHNTTTSPAEKRERDATEGDATADDSFIEPRFVKLKIEDPAELKM